MVETDDTQELRQIRPRADDSEEVRPRRASRRNRRVAIAVAILSVLSASALTVAMWPGGDTKPATGASDSAHVKTAVVTKADLSNAQTLQGTLGYGKPFTVKGGKSGLITWLAKPGTTVKRGRALYKVDNNPVPVFYGGTPLYRTLSARGTTGPDVKVVVDNLRALGFDVGAQPAPGTWVTQQPLPADEPAASTDESAAKGDTAEESGSPSSVPSAPAPTPTSVKVTQGDGVLTTDLTAAIKRWQTFTGAPATGTLGIGDIAVMPGPVRVDAVQAQSADQADGALMTVTSTAKSVGVPVEASDAGTMARGDKVTVTLPDNSTVKGTVTAIGTTVQSSPDNGGGGGSDGPAQLTVSISVPDSEAIRKLTSAPVQVQFTSETRKGVLTVPVDALLALSEGGYAVQRPDGRLVAVKTGMFAKGLVEISGTGVTAGLRVVTTS
ncbi:hypothetical protein ACI2L1_34665 [Streptomyces sp. NPDC019531]|uniref:hypothetical protein n=1 Tax=Streptomyces sp. NPDC019531 TaxID=3365062 RepID=UPI00384EC54A